MKVTLWGTRGSLGCYGPEVVRYGGNTSCVEVRAADGGLVVLDAGTGVRRLSATVGPDVQRVDVLLTHLHMDHIQGLGFFGPLYRPGLDVRVWGPPSTTLHLRERLSRYLSPPLFPVRLRDLPCKLSLEDVPFGRFEIGNLTVTADLVCHPGPTVGYRIEEGGASLAYVSDHEPALGARRFPEEPQWTSGFDLVAGADLLIHDAQYDDDEYPEHVGWGHPSLSQAVAFAAAAGVRRFVTFHHDPSHSDDQLDAMLERVRRSGPLPLELVAGKEGASFRLVA